MQASRADIAAGRVQELEDVLRELDDDADELEAIQLGKKASSVRQ